MDKGRITVTPTSIEVKDKTGAVRMRMGAIGDEPVRRARLYVYGQPQVRIEVTSQNNWEEAMLLRDVWGPGHMIYLWRDSGDPQTEWTCMGQYGWRYAVPPKEIALTHYLLEGE